REGALPAEGAALPPGPDEHVLGQLLGEGRVRRHPHAERVHLAFVLPVEPLEGGQVSGLRQAYEAPFLAPPVLVAADLDGDEPSHADDGLRVRAALLAHIKMPGPTTGFEGRKPLNSRPVFCFREVPTAPVRLWSNLPG